MKKRMIFGVLASLFASAFASCAADDASDALVPDTGKKTITVSAEIVQTRTQLSADHKLSWVEGDTFGILTSANGTNILENIEAPAYKPGKTSYDVEVSSSAQYIYFYYPYSEDVRTGYMFGFGSTFTLPADYGEVDGYKGQFLPQYDFMAAAGGEIVDGKVNVAHFAPVVSIIEFNVYGAAGETLQSLTLEADNCVGQFQLKYPDGQPLADPSYTNSILAMPIAGGAVLKEAKADGVKVYANVFKKEYSAANVVAVTDKDTYIFDFASIIDCTNDGVTVNLNLAKAAHRGEHLVTVSAEATSSWTANVTIAKDVNCSRYAVAAFPTENYDESLFVANAASSIEQSTGSYPFVSYYVSTKSETIDETYLYYESVLGGNPVGLNLKPLTDYTVAVYAVSREGETEIATATFHTPALVFDGISEVTIDASADLSSAVATITASNCVKLFYGYTAASTVNANNAEFTKIDYKEPVKITAWFGEDLKSYTFYAAGIDADGKIGNFVTKRVSQKLVTSNPDAKITGCEFGDLISEGYSTMLKLRLTMSPEVTKVHILNYSQAGWTQESASGPKYEEIESDIQRTAAYSREEVEADDFAIIYPQPYTAHHLFAMGEDAKGSFGPIVNLVGCEEIKDNKTAMAKTLQLEEPKPEAPKYWNQTLGGEGREWLQLSGSAGNTTVSSKGVSAASKSGVETLFILRLNLDGESSSSWDAERFSKNVMSVFNSYDYDPSNPLSFSPGWSKLYVGEVQDVVLSGLSSTAFSGSWGGTAYVVVLGDAQGNLTMKCAAYFKSSTAQYVDLTGALE